MTAAIVDGHRRRLRTIALPLMVAVGIGIGLTGCGETPEQKYEACLQAFVDSGQPDDPDMPAALVCQLVADR